MFAAVTHLAEGLGLETFLTSKVGKYLISLMGTLKPTVNFVVKNVNKK
jgi:hypothetical protein